MRFSKKRRLFWGIVSTALAIALGGMAAPEATADTSRLLSITHYEQQKDLWCGPTALQVLVRYNKGTYHPQCYYWNQIHGYSPLSALCANTVANHDEMAVGLAANFAHPGNWNGKKLTWSPLTSNIDASRPIIGEIGWKDPRGPGTLGTHYVTVYGYQEVGSTRYVYYSNQNAAVGFGTSAAHGRMPIKQFQGTANPSFRSIDNRVKIY